MKNYLDLLQEIVNVGELHPDRTKVGRISLFGRELRYDLSKGEFPLLTTKKVFMRGIIEELLWFISGSSDASELVDKNVHIWDDWMVNREHIEKYIKDKNIDPVVFLNMIHIAGSIGPIYGASWRNVKTMKPKEVDLTKLASDKVMEVEDFIEKCEARLGSENTLSKQDLANTLYGCVIDQLQELMINLKERPHSSRHVISSWIPDNIPDETKSPQENVIEGRGALAPCHVMQQYFVSPPLVAGGKKRLSLKMCQRSSDVPLGVPFNIASYSLFLMMIAQCVDMEPYEFIWSSGDTHIYANQMEGAKEQLTRTPGKLPTMKINPDVKDIYSFKLEDFTLVDYNPQPVIAYPRAV